MDALRDDPDPTGDFLDGFAEAPADADPVPSGRALLLTSAGMTLVGVLGAIGFVAGAMWASLHEPDLGYDNLVAELAIKIGFSLFVGALCGAIVVALSIAVVAVFVLRERRRVVHGIAPTDTRQPSDARAVADRNGPTATPDAPTVPHTPDRPAGPPPAPARPRRERSH